MRLVIKTFFFHIMCILFFTILYYSKRHLFAINKTRHLDFIDFLFLSTTIQAGVGYSEIYPMYDTAKIFMIIQQLLLISTHIFTIYIFTI
jgi:hypothetical protein